MSKPRSAAVIEARNKAKRQGWLKWIRQGEGEEADELAMLHGCYFDMSRAANVIDFFERFGVLTEGAWAGKEFTLLDWQYNWLARGFGWVRRSESWKRVVRRFRYHYLEVPKKNGKTPLVATVGNYLLLADDPESQINIFLAATTRKQAERCLLHAIRAYKFRPEMEMAVKTTRNDGYYSVSFNDNNWTVLAADPESADGVNGHVLADELHRWKGHEFFNTLRWSLATQPQGLFIGITTAGADQDGVCYTCHEKTKQVNTGKVIDQQWYGTIFGAAKDDDPHSEATWRKSNPSLGDDEKSPLKIDSFRADYEAANGDPTQWHIWQQLRIGIWRNARESWVDIDLWDAGEAVREASPDERIDCFETFTLTQAPAGRKWNSLDSVMALDASTVRDTTAAVFTFEHPVDEGSLISIPFYWIPENRAIELGEKVPFRPWSEGGFIKLTPGDAVDFDIIFDDLIKLMKFYQPNEFYYDPNFQAVWMAQRISDELQIEAFEFRQTMAMYSAAMKMAERMIHAKTWRHNGNPIFSWQLGNLKASSDTMGNMRPVKQKHGDFRTVDGPVCGIMTLRKWLTLDADDFEPEELEID